MAKLPEYFCFKVKPDPKKLVFEIERAEAEEVLEHYQNKPTGNDARMIPVIGLSVPLADMSHYIPGTNKRYFPNIVRTVGA